VALKVCIAFPIEIFAMRVGTAEPLASPFRD
jgi:hypothetical protein